MQLGDTVAATGPRGRLTLIDEPVKHYYLIATGTGVTPYIAMLPSLEKRMQLDPALCVSLWFGIRHPEDVLYRTRLLDFAKKHTQFKVQFHYSRVTALECKELYECAGYVTHSLEELPAPADQEWFYLCGNPSMIDDAYRLLCEKGCNPTRIKRKYTRSKPKV